MTQLLERAPQIDPGYTDEIFTKLVNEFNRQGDPLQDELLPLHATEHPSLPIFEQTTEDLGMNWGPKHRAPDVQTHRQPEPDIDFWQFAAQGLELLGREPALQPQVSERRTDYDSSSRTIERVLGGLKRPDDHDPHGQLTAERPPRTARAVGRAAVEGASEATPASMADPKLDKRFRDFMGAHNVPGNDSYVNTREIRSHRRESRLRRIGARIGVACLASAVVFPLVDALMSRIAKN